MLQRGLTQRCDEGRSPSIHRFGGDGAVELHRSAPCRGEADAELTHAVNARAELLRATPTLTRKRSEADDAVPQERGARVDRRHTPHGSFNRLPDVDVMEPVADGAVAPNTSARAPRCTRDGGIGEQPPRARGAADDLVDKQPPKNELGRKNDERREERRERRVVVR